MTNPLTTPSGIPASTPIPRNPDGSPMPRMAARAVRAKRRAERAVDLPEGQERQERNEAYTRDVRARGTVQRETNRLRGISEEEFVSRSVTADESWPEHNALTPDQAEERLRKYEELAKSYAEEPPRADEQRGPVEVVQATPHELGLPDDYDTNDHAPGPAEGIGGDPLPEPKGFVTAEDPTKKVVETEKRPDEDQRSVTVDEGIARGEEIVAKVTAPKPAKKASPRKAPAKKAAPKFPPPSEPGKGIEGVDY